MIEISIGKGSDAFYNKNEHGNSSETFIRVSFQTKARLKKLKDRLNETSRVKHSYNDVVSLLINDVDNEAEASNILYEINKLLEAKY